MVTLIFLTFFVKNWENNIENKNLFCSTYFRSNFHQLRRFRKSDPPKFVEVVINLFMNLQTSTVTKLVNLGIKLELIEFVSQILWHFNSIFIEMSNIKRLSNFWWVGIRTVLPDSLEITFFDTKSIQKAMEFFVWLFTLKTAKITL